MCGFSLCGGLTQKTGLLLGRGGLAVQTNNGKKCPRLLRPNNDSHQRCSLVASHVEKYCLAFFSLSMTAVFQEGPPRRRVHMHRTLATGRLSQRAGCCVGASCRLALHVLQRKLLYAPVCSSLHSQSVGNGNEHLLGWSAPQLPHKPADCLSGF